MAIISATETSVSLPTPAIRVLPQSSYSRPPSPKPSGSISRLPTNTQLRLNRVLTQIDQLRKLDKESTDKRREKRHAYRNKDKEEENGKDVPQACVTCRKAKTKCLNLHGEPCARCNMAGEVCTYPAPKKRGRRVNTGTQEVLQQIEDDITTILLAQQTGAEDAPPVIEQPSEQAIETNEAATHTDIQNPLGFLASAAIDQDKEAQSAPGPSKYWSGIYDVKTESDFSQDPVLLGFLTEDDLTRLVSIYFTNLRPFFMHLDPVVHTPSFLRFNSPFLTTAIAALAASYDLQSTQISAPLMTHAHQLAAQAFAAGYKSLEIVQAYLMIYHWTARFPPFWSEDRSWAYQGQAMRLACEIRLDLPPNKDILNHYKLNRHFTEEEKDRLLACRKRTYLLVSLSEIAMASQSGRADTTSGHRLLRAPTLPFLPPGDPTNERFAASVHLTHIFARALHHWHNSEKETAERGGREQFILSWKRQLEDWTSTHSEQDRLLDLFGTNNHIMLILLALRIRGSHQSTLDLLKQMNELAVYFLSSVFRWFQQESFYGPGGLAYAHDFLVVNIAYAAVLAHKLSSGPNSSIGADAKLHIGNALTILDQMVNARPNIVVSTASLLAAQIRRLTNTADTNLPQVPTPLADAIANASLNPTYLFFGQSPAGHFDFDFTLPTLPPFDDHDPFYDFMTGHEAQ